MLIFCQKYKLVFQAVTIRPLSLNSSFFRFNHFFSFIEHIRIKLIVQIPLSIHFILRISNYLYSQFSLSRVIFHSIFTVFQIDLDLFL